MLASALRGFFLWLSHLRWVAWLALHTPLLRRVALRFVAGTTLDQAAEAVRALNASGAMATLDVLGESVEDRAAADRAAAEYVATIERIAAEGLDANVSLKLTQMGLDLGVEECLEVIAPVVEAGARHRIFVRIDMESSAYVDRTLEVVARLRAGGCDIGPVIQAYLHRSAEDVERLAADRVRTRICKGAYNEPPEVAFPDKKDVDENYVRVMQVMLASGVYHGIATHDPHMIDATIAFAQKQGIGKEAFEFQMLYGVRRDLQKQLAKDGYNMRVYVPYGKHWYPYFMRRLAERPANVWFVMKNVLKG